MDIGNFCTGDKLNKKTHGFQNLAYEYVHSWNVSGKNQNAEVFRNMCLITELIQPTSCDSAVSHVISLFHFALVELFRSAVSQSLQYSKKSNARMFQKRCFYTRSWKVCSVRDNLQAVLHL